MNHPTQSRGDDERREGGGANPPPRSATTSMSGGATGWRRLVRMGAPRATKANALATVLALLLGFAIVTQVRQTRSEGLDALRQTELVGLLDDVSQRSDRLDKDAAQLRRTRDELVSGGASDREARKAARERLSSLEVLAGTVPAKGPGITITIGDPRHEITDSVLLDALQELRDAGAEAVQIGPVRVVASTYFGTAQDGTVQVDGVGVRPPYRILAIGDPHTMAAAMAIPGGLAENVRQLGGHPAITQSQTVHIDALHSPPAHRYAQPVPTATPTQ